jgi:hypothetical protein
MALRVRRGQRWPQGRCICTHKNVRTCKHRANGVSGASASVAPRLRQRSASGQDARGAVLVARARTKKEVFPRGHDWSVHKFGGTCVSAAERISEAAKVVVEVRHLRFEQRTAACSELPVTSIGGWVRPMA